MDQSEYRGIQLAPDYLDRIKSSKARPLQAKGTIVSELRLLSILGLTDDELQKKISLHYKKSGDARSFEEEKPRIIRTIIGVLHQAEGGILKDTREELAGHKKYP